MHDEMVAAVNQSTPDAAIGSVWQYGHPDGTVNRIRGGSGVAEQAGGLRRCRVLPLAVGGQRHGMVGLDKQARARDAILNDTSSAPWQAASLIDSRRITRRQPTT